MKSSTTKMYIYIYKTIFKRKTLESNYFCYKKDTILTDNEIKTQKIENRVTMPSNLSYFLMVNVWVS